MIRLLLLLVGAEAVQRRWAVLLGLGAFWFLLGVVVFLDSLDGVTLLPVRDFGYLLLLEGLLALLASSAMSAGMARRVRWAKAAALIGAGVLTIDAPWRSDIMLALILGVFFAVDGAMRIIAARLIRFPGWRSSQAAGGLILVLAVLTLQPWPTWYVGTVGCNVGIALAVTGGGIVRLALRLRRLPPAAPISALLSPGLIGWGAFAAAAGADATDHASELVVRVWTPTGDRPIARPLIDRYVAAVDATGVVSTGHAALECRPDIYISHYPAAEIDRSPDQFSRALRATPDNDVPGRFLPSYPAEVAGWCEANGEVRFRDFDMQRFRAFWAAYSGDTTYNLTKRNCSSVVAHALDAALEGRLARKRPRLPVFFRALSSPELWIAGQLRKRAETMAWTPGLVFDYARALSAVVEPPDGGLAALLRRATRRPQPRL